MNNNEIRKSMVQYQSLSFAMIRDLLENKDTPSYIRVWLYFSILNKYDKTIFAKNNYISNKLQIPISTVKFAISKLRDDGYIEIVNSGTWKRQIKLTHIAIINEEDNQELKQDNERAYHSIYNRKLYKDHIYLTEDEYNATEDLFKDELEFYLDGLNNYLKLSKIKYSTHFKMLWTWYDKNQEQIKKKKKKYNEPNYTWFKEFEREYILQKEKKSTEEVDYNILDKLDWLNDYLEDED